MPVRSVIKQDDALGISHGPNHAGIKVDTTDRTLQFNDQGTMRTVVTTDQTQTLTNKTLTAPTITAPVLGVASATSMALTATTNQIATGASSNITTVNFPASSGAVTLTMPNTTDTIVGLATTNTLTNKTLTAPAISAPVLSGTATGTYTLAGTGTLTSPAINTATITTPTIAGAIVQDTAFCTTQFDATSGTTGTTFTNVVGMSLTVVAGTYLFDVMLPGVSTANNGCKYCFKYTTTVVTTLEATGMEFTASAVAVQHTTTTSDQASLAASTAANIYTRITGRMVVGTGGTVALQAAQNASHGDTTSVYVGASMTFKRIS